MSTSHQSAASIAKNAADFFEGTGIYHKPYFHSGYHYVVGEQFTNIALEEEMTRILREASPCYRLPSREEQIACYYFGNLSVKPWMISVVESACGEPRFSCKLIDGSILRPDFPQPKPPVVEAQKGGAHVCIARGCTEPVSGRLQVGLFSILDLCTEHIRVTKNKISPSFI
jgi:hypothetical protein